MRFVLLVTLGILSGSWSLAGEDLRTAVHYPPELKAETLAKMRDHLATLQAISAALAREDYDEAASLARSRLGMGSMDPKESQLSRKYMPKEMFHLGVALHKEAGRFAMVAEEEEMNATLGAFSDLTARCVVCHSRFRFE